MRVRWTSVAADDLTSICDFIRKDSSQAALRVGQLVYKGVEALQKFPSRGRPGRVEGTRELVVTGLPYVVDEVHTEAVVILRVLHGAMRWPQ